MGVNYLRAYLFFQVLGGTPDVGWQQVIPPFFMIHIGQLIKSELIRQERTPTWLARKINCDRSNMYYIFSQQSINTDLLLRISRALNHDFFLHYTTEFSTNTTEDA